MSTFPQPFLSSVSHWQATNRGPKSLYLHNKDATPPPTADIVIVGGGTMGASLSYFLTREGAEGAGKTVVLVEAKDVGSGASGRNGGHVGPATFEGWKRTQLPSPLGAGVDEKEGIHIIQAERENLDLIESIVHKEGIAAEVDWWRGELCETHHNMEQTLARKAHYAEWLAARKKYYDLPGNGDTKLITDVEEAKRVSRFKDVTSVQLRPAGSVHSHKLCTALMRLAVESKHSNFQLYSYTPVSAIDSITSAGEDFKWSVKTAKGEIKAKRVVLCTNAHTQNFFPKGDPLHTHIAPCFIQCAVVTPPPTFSGEGALAHTYNMEKGWYLIQTPMGGIVVGGGEQELVEDGKFAPGFNIGQEDDSFVIDEWTKIQGNYCKDHFEGWGPEALGEGLSRAWSGILTRVKDTLPLVGPVPDKEAMFIAAGFAGHGQSRIFSVARALASQLQTGVFDETLLPRSFEITKERLERCRKLGHTPEDADELGSARTKLALKMAAEFVPTPPGTLRPTAEETYPALAAPPYVESQTLPSVLREKEHPVAPPITPQYSEKVAPAKAKKAKKSFMSAVMEFLGLKRSV